MRAEVVILGTSSMVPTKERNHPAVYFRYEKDRLLFDCGEGTQRQLTTAGLSMGKINHIFITHLHGDHILGLPGVIQTDCVRGREEELTVVGPKRLKSVLENLLDLSEFERKFEVNIVEAKGRVLETEDYFVEAFGTKHSRDSVGYVFQENEVRNVNEAALRKIGLDPSPLYKKIKAGEKVKWKGKVIDGKKYVKMAPGLKVVYTGDTAYSEKIIKVADGADLLIHESTYAQDIAEKAKEYNHSTAKEAALVAREANVKQLVLTHFSTRYKEEQLDKLLRDAKKEFENVVLAKDFMKIEL